MNTRFSNKLLPIIILIMIALVPLFSLLTPGFPVTHDGQDHIARIANFYQALTDGVLVPRWAANLNWGYGHPILMFLYPLPSYVGSFFHSLGFSFVDSTKLVFAFFYIASIVTMYLFASESWGKRVGVIAAIIYGFTPYRFVDLYVRGAIGEHAAFMFPPLILYFLLKVARSYGNGETKLDTVYRIPYAIAATFSLAALILAHNAISLMFLPIIILYVVYLYFFEAHNSFMHQPRSTRFLVSCFLCISFGFGLSAFFWAPALIEGKYTLRDIVTAGSFEGRFVPFLWFIYSPWNYGQGTEFTKSLGAVPLLGMLLAFGSAFFTRVERKSVVLLVSLLTLTIMSVFLMTSSSAYIWQHITLIQKFQFPWRILTVTTFTGAILAALGIDWLIGYLADAIRKMDWTNNKEQISKKSRYTIIAPYLHILRASLSYIEWSLVFAICSLTILSTSMMWHPKEYRQKPETFFTGIYDSTTDTGESAPIWSVRFMEHRATAPMEVVDGKIEITEVSRNTIRHEYSVKSEKGGQVVENTLYFPGWNVYVDGSLVGVEYQNPEYRGLMTFMVPPGTHEVSIRFTETKFRRVSNIISIASLLVLVLLLAIAGIVYSYTKYTYGK